MTNTPFDWQQYIKLQTQAILNYLEDSPRSWPLYLEIGGHFLIDNHAKRVLPGYITDSKAQIFQRIAEYVNLSIIFCINAKDIVRDRQFSQKYLSFENYLMNELKKCESVLKIKPEIAITMIDYNFTPPHVKELEISLKAQWYKIFYKYLIDHYPNNSEYILSEQWYGKDNHIPLAKWISWDICLVAACGSNSGKFSTCISQLYLDYKWHIDSQYAKFETFPIWSLPIDHPINLAYEAAMADIDEWEIIKSYSSQNKKLEAQKIIYNKDMRIFEILQAFGEISHLKTKSWKNLVLPTEVLINTTGLCILNDEKSGKDIYNACYNEIQSRLQIYNKLLLSWHGEEEAVTRCKELLKKLK